MTATATAPVQMVEDQVRREQEMLVNNFKMPRPAKGQAVTWYPNANPQQGEVAFVLRVEHRTIWVQRASGTAMQTVRHIDDPKLQLSEHQRQSGAWDFTEFDKEMVKLLQTTVPELKRQIADLQRRLDSPVIEDKPKAAKEKAN